MGRARRGRRGRRARFNMGRARRGRRSRRTILNHSRARRGRRGRRARFNMGRARRGRRSRRTILNHSRARRGRRGRRARHNLSRTRRSRHRGGRSNSGCRGHQNRSCIGSYSCGRSCCLSNGAGRRSLGRRGFRCSRGGRDRFTSRMRFNRLILIIRIFVLCNCVLTFLRHAICLDLPGS